MAAEVTTDPQKAAPTATSLFQVITKLFKAIPRDKLDDIIDVEDMWTAGTEHSNPSGADLGVGPSESMRGGNASAMINRHSDASPTESRMVQQYDAFGRMMGDMRKALMAMKATVADLAKNQEVLVDGFKGLAEAETAKADAEKAAQAAAAAEVISEDSFLGKALSKLVKARGAFRKSELEDEDKVEIRRGHLAEAEAALKAAKRLLQKADDEGEDIVGDRTEKAVVDLKTLNDRVIKSLAEIQKAEDDKKDEDKKEKESEEAKKSDTEESKAETGAVAEATDKSGVDPVALQSAVDLMHKAVEGHAVLEIQMKNFMDVFMQASKNSVRPPDIGIVKGVPDDKTLEARIDEARDDGTLQTASEATLASSLLMRLRKAEAGVYPKENFHRDLQAAPENVRSLFQAAA